jgi:hypothetical protein
MSTKDDGGPAFPQQAIRDGDGTLAYGLPTGLSIRDCFAAAALCGIEAAQGRNGNYFDLTGNADRAYQVADAMLKARVQL